MIRRRQPKPLRHVRQRDRSRGQKKERGGRRFWGNRESQQRKLALVNLRMDEMAKSEVYQRRLAEARASRLPFYPLIDPDGR